MAEQQNGLLPFYKGWETYQGLLVAAIAPLSTEQLALRAAPHLRTIGENAAHIIGCRVSWFHHIMGEGSAELAPLGEWDVPDAPSRSAAELVSGLNTSWQLVYDTLARLTPNDLDADCTYKPSDGEEEHFKRQWIIWHVIEHDLHHGGEVSLTLGMHHLTAPDL